MSERDYFAVPDPDDPARMTYWTTDTRRGRRRPWPPKARYGPFVGRQLDSRDLKRLLEWGDAIDAAIAADPNGCRARFAVFTSRCLSCGRHLTDPESKAYGIGPECRSGVSHDTLALFTELVGRAHAAHLSKSSP